MPQLASKAVPNQEAEFEPGTVSQVQGKDDTKRPCRDIENWLEERRIGDGAMAAVGQLVTD